MGLELFPDCEHNLEQVIISQVKFFSVIHHKWSAKTSTHMGTHMSGTASGRSAFLNGC